MCTRQYVVFYDARCPLCRRVRSFLEDRPGAPLRFVDVHSWLARLRWPMIDWKHAQQQVQVLRPDGRVDNGFTAVTKLLSTRSRFIRFFEPLLRLWPLQSIGQLGYHVVSANRYPISRALFERGTKMKLRKKNFDAGEVVKGCLAGAAAGFVASWTMNRFQGLLTKLKPDKQQNAQRDSDEDQEEQDTTVKTAKLVSRRLLHKELTKTQAQRGGKIVHYTFGTTLGFVYGGLCEALPAAKTGLGTVYGLAIWAFADEGLLPLSGLTKPPGEYPLSTHANALAAHLVYGASTELVRRTLRTVLR